MSKDILTRLTGMDYERNGGSSSERLIFPNIFPSQAKEDKELEKYFRISEQELRFLFIEEFLKVPNLFYSVETPTKSKYKFGKNFEYVSVDIKGRSASIDMCVLERISTVYNRILNVEFKHQNSSLFSFGKDILKLMNEEQDGAFIILLRNTDKGTLCNDGKTGVLDKLNKSFTKFKDIDVWKGNDEKYIQLIILSLEQKKDNISPVLIHRKVFKHTLSDLEACFTINSTGYGNIKSVSEDSGWKKEPII